MDKAAASKEIRNIFSAYKKLTPTDRKILNGLKKGKLYELYVLSWVVRDLAKRGFILTFNGTSLQFKGSPGKIKNSEPHFQITSPNATAPPLYLFVDIEFDTLGSTYVGVSDMGRLVPHGSQDHREFLLIELKRPSLSIGRKELDQLEDYVNSILAQPDFVNTSNNWNFYLVTSEYDDVVKERITQENRAAGLFIDKPNHKVWVKSWAELLREAEGRLKFVQDQLRIEVSTDEIEKRIAELKASVLKSEALDLGEGSAEMTENGTQGGRKRSSKAGNQPPSPPP